jgi:hypothetical protein
MLSNKQSIISYAILGSDPLRALTCIDNDQEIITVSFTHFFRERGVQPLNVAPGLIIVQCRLSRCFKQTDNHLKQN